MGNQPKELKPDEGPSQEDIAKYNNLPSDHVSFSTRHKKALRVSGAVVGSLLGATTTGLIIDRAINSNIENTIPVSSVPGGSSFENNRLQFPNKVEASESKILEQEIPYLFGERGAYSNADRGVQIATNEAEMKNLLKRDLTQEEKNRLRSYIAVRVSSGQKNSGGFEVETKRIFVEKGTRGNPSNIIVEVTEYAPDKDMITIQSLTNPYEIDWVSKADIKDARNLTKEIRWVNEEKIPTEIYSTTQSNYDLPVGKVIQHQAEWEKEFRENLANRQGLADLRNNTPIPPFDEKTQTILIVSPGRQNVTGIWQEVIGVKEYLDRFEAIVRLHTLGPDQVGAQVINWPAKVFAVSKLNKPVVFKQENQVQSDQMFNESNTTSSNEDKITIAGNHIFGPNSKSRQTH